MNVVNKFILLLSISLSSYASECLTFVVKDKITANVKEGTSVIKVKNRDLYFDCWKDGKALRCAGDNDGGLFYVYKDKVEFHYISFDEGAYQNIPKKPITVKRESCK